MPPWQERSSWFVATTGWRPVWRWAWSRISSSTVFASPRKRGRVGICALVAQIPCEGAPPQPELGGECEPVERPLTPTLCPQAGRGNRDAAANAYWGSANTYTALPPVTVSASGVTRRAATLDPPPAAMAMYWQPFTEYVTVKPKACDASRVCHRTLPSSASCARR